MRRDASRLGWPGDVDDDPEVVAPSAEGDRL